MRYPLCPESRSILDDLDRLRTEAQNLLDVASSGARDEWKKLEDRFPSVLEIRRGFIALSKLELNEMRSKVSRFGKILASSRDESRSSGAASDSAVLAADGKTR